MAHPRSSDILPCRKCHTVNWYRAPGGLQGRICKTCRERRRNTGLPRGYPRSDVPKAERQYTYILKFKYGLVRSDYQALIARQDGKCAGCQRRVKLTVDHDHVTGRVRGLLCRTCNLALGAVRDDPVVLEALIGYLQITSETFSS